MKTENLIQELAAQVKPVIVTNPPWRSFMNWLGLTLPPVVIVVFLWGMRSDLDSIRSDPLFWTQLGLGLLTALVSGLAALVLSIPGSRYRLLSVAVAALLMAWFSSLFLSERNSPPDWGVACGLLVLFFSSLPGLVLWRQVHRGVSLEAGLTGFFAGLAAAVVGAIATQLLCPKNAAAHLLAWHFLPAVTAAGICIFLGRRWLRARFDS